MSGRLVSVLAVAAAVFGVSASLAAAQEQKSCDAAATLASPYDGQYWSGANLPFTTLREHLDLRWSQRAIETADLFPAREMIEAAAALAGEPPPDASAFRLFETYVSPGGDEQPYATAYVEAAVDYRQGSFARAIPAFDAVVADRKSPYRAAAAYSAARAALLLGRTEDGIKRLDRLIDDPHLAEFRSAALKLVGTLHYQYRTAPLLAARFAQIKYLLSVPPILICRYPFLAPLVKEAQDDLAWLQTQKSEDPRAATDGPPVTPVMDVLGRTSPFVDVLRVLWAPTPYALDYGWLDDFSFVDWKDSRLRTKLLYREKYANYDPAPVMMRAKDLTAHARTRWRETKNVLWAYALARRTADVADVEILKQAIAALGETPPTAEARSSNLLLRRSLTAQATRVLLMAGRTDDAIALLETQIETITRLRQISYRGWYGNDNPPVWATSFVLNGGIRLFLQRRDLKAANDWAARASKVLDYDSPYYGLKVQPAVQLKVLLAASPKELASAVAEDGRLSWGGAESLLAVADLLPADAMVEMAQGPNVPPDVRRALLAAGWTRTYLLGREDKALALLPQVRTLFPELKGDVDDIAGASFEFSRKHAITRMLLRAPGFHPRARWLHRARGTKADIFSVATGNPSDGNWWCPLDTALLKADMGLDYIAKPLNNSPVSMAWYDSYFARPPEDRARLVAFADEFIAWHPLFKLIDEEELDALSRIDSGPKMLTEQTVAWAEWSNVITWALGFDEALPETLHLAVRSTRYGCRRNGPHGAYSRAAFNYLHDRYPSSEWTRKTPYWFDAVRPY
jgi:hypothetical protein